MDGYGMKHGRGAQRSARAALLAVALAEALLFCGYHAERWSKGLARRDAARPRAGEGLVIRCDGLGYYAWLRSALVDGDWSFDNEFDAYNVLGDFVPPPDARTEIGRRANPWSVGPACVWATTVVPGHFLLSAFQSLGCPCAADGYTLPYQLLVGLTTLGISWLGLVCLYGVCRHFATPAQAALATGLVTLGSPIIYYSAIEGSMAHGVGCATVAGLVCYWLKTYGATGGGRWLRVGVLLGCATLMRWQLFTLALLPAGEALLGNPSVRVGTTRRLGLLALAALGAFLAFMPQLTAWQCVYGRWLPSPIPVSHNWLNPAWWQVLFAEDRGLCYWTPLALVGACASLACAWRLRTGPAVLPLVAFALQVYVLASLWGTGVYLGAAFGFRQLTESLVLLAPGLAYLLGRVPGRYFSLACAVGGLLAFWNLLLICEYRYSLLPADGGADLATMAATGLRLLSRKPWSFVGQAVLAPLLLSLLAARSFPGPACKNPL
jgi:hypothetical protein